MLFTNLCERFIHSSYGGIWGIVVFGLSGFFFVFCACWRSRVGFFTSWFVQDLGLVGVPFLGHALWALIGKGITNLITGKKVWQFIIQLFFPGFGFIFSWGFFLDWKPYMLALVRQPSLHGYYACMVFWDKGALWRNCRLKKL